jgi:DNA-binding transcriptional LysR family regulator
MKDFVNLLDVHVACTIGDTLNLAKAAKKLSMPRATLVASLLRLERRLDNRIFERRQGSGAVNLTEYGTIILPLFDQLIWVHKNIMKHNKSGDNKKRGGEFIVASTQSILEGFILPYLKAFLNEHENIKAGIHQHDDISTIKQGVNQIYIGLWLGDTKNYTYFPFHTFRHKLWASQSYLEQWGAPLKVEDLVHHSILEQKNVNDKDIVMGNDLISRVLAQYADSINIIDVAGIRVVDRMAELGLGIMIASEEMVKLAGLKLQRVLPDFMGDSIELFLRVNKEFLQTPLAQLVVDWIFHCRDIAFASAGMAPSVEYNPFNPKM